MPTCLHALPFCLFFSLQAATVCVMSRTMVTGNGGNGNGEMDISVMRRQAGGLFGGVGFAARSLRGALFEKSSDWLPAHCAVLRKAQSASLSLLAPLGARRSGGERE